MKTHDINVVVVVESESKVEAMGKVEQMFDDYYKNYVETTPIVEYKIVSVDGCDCESCQGIARSGTP
jgi:hypothetical protein